MWLATLGSLKEDEMTEDHRFLPPTDDLWPVVPKDEKSEPDPEGAKFHERDSAGNLVETRPKHHVDPLAKTEAVVGSAAPRSLYELAQPKTFLDWLRAAAQQKMHVSLVDRRGKEYEGLLSDVGDQFVLMCHGDRSESVILLEWIVSMTSSPFGRRDSVDSGEM